MNSLMLRPKNSDTGAHRHGEGLGRIGRLLTKALTVHSRILPIIVIYSISKGPGEDAL